MAFTSDSVRGPLVDETRARAASITYRRDLDLPGPVAELNGEPCYRNRIL